MKATHLAAGALLCLVFAAAEALADATLIYEEGSGSNYLRIAQGKVRLDARHDAGWMLFDAERRTLTMVDPMAREYRVLDEAAADAIAGTAGAMMQTMDAQLAALPPQMRDQMRQMQGGILPGGGKQPAVVETTGRHGAAAGFDCAYSRVLVQGAPPSEVCLAPAESLGLSPADRATINAWQDFARAMAGKAAAFISVDPAIFGSDGQVPLIYRHGDTSGALSKVESAAVEPELMRIPAGYRQQELAPMLR